jgi:hypothetical protein
LSEPQPLNPQADRLAAAKAAQAAREAGIHANAVKKGRELERAEMAVRQAEIAATHAGELQGITKAHTEEIARLDERWSREEAKHGGARFWSGMFTGAMCAGAIAAIGTAILVQMTLVPTFEAARQARVQDDVVRATERYAAPLTNP